MKTVHVAGPPVVINGRVVQRCAWCGEKLLDSKNTVGLIGPNGEPPTFPTYGERRLIEFEPGDGFVRSIDVGDFVETEELPPEFCHDLVE